MDHNIERHPDVVVHVTDWQPQGVQRCLAASSRNFVGLMEDGRSVLKYPHIRSQNSMEALYEEAARYDHLGRHDNLVVFQGIHPDGLVFEYCEGGQLEDVISNTPCLPEDEKFKIAKQVVECLIHLHEHNFIHCDLNVNNVFMTSAMDVRVGDIQGQLYRTDGTVEMPTMSQENAKSRHPYAGDDEFSPRTDIFALGTLLYYLWHGTPPFPDLNEYTEDAVIQARYRAGKFPIDSSRAAGVDRIISRCWNSRYGRTTEVLEDIMNLCKGKPE